MKIFKKIFRGINRVHRVKIINTNIIKIIIKLIPVFEAMEHLPWS